MRATSVTVTGGTDMEFTRSNHGDMTGFTHHQVVVTAALAGTSSVFVKPFGGAAYEPAAVVAGVATHTFTVIDAGVHEAIKVVMSGVTTATAKLVSYNVVNGRIV